MNRPAPNSGKSAWDYGLPQDAVEITTAALTEGLGGCDTLVNGSRLVIPNIAAAIVYDLITQGVMAPVIPDEPPQPRDAS